MGIGSVFPNIFQYHEQHIFYAQVESQEVKVILKTPLMHYHAIQSYILNHCSYEVPEIVQVDINQGNPSYLSWIFQETEL